MDYASMTAADHPAGTTAQQSTVGVTAVAQLENEAKAELIKVAAQAKALLAAAEQSILYPLGHQAESIVEGVEAEAHKLLAMLPGLRKAAKSSTQAHTSFGFRH